MNLKINHRINVDELKFFNKFSLDLRFDSVASVFSVEYFFNPQNKKHAELSCVSHFHEAIFEHNNELLVNAYILTQVFKDSPKRELVKIEGYSKSGCFEDSDIPPELYPLQTDGMSVKQIAERLIGHFGLRVIIDPEVESEMNQAIPKSTAEATETIKDYLTKITAQRDVIMTHNVDGDVVFTKAKTNLRPIAHFETGMIGTDMELSFIGQPMHSHITVRKEASHDGGNSGQHTIRNPFVPIVKRYKTIIQSSGTDNTVEKTAMAALSEELKNIKLVINTDRWQLNDTIIKPNNMITVKNPKLFLYKKTDWFIESIKYTGDEKKTVSALTCVLPEVYNKKMPKNIFVDPHQNLPRF